MSAKRKFEDENDKTEDVETEVNPNVSLILQTLQKEIIESQKKSKKECDLLKRRVNELFEDTLTKNKESEELHTENLRLKNELCSKVAEIKRLKLSVQEFAKLRKENTSLMKQLSATKRTTESSKLKLSNCDAEIQHYKNELQFSQKAVLNLKKEKQNLEKQLLLLRTTAKSASGAIVQHVQNDDSDVEIVFEITSKPEVSKKTIDATVVTSSPETSTKCSIATTLVGENSDNVSANENFTNVISNVSREKKDDGRKQITETSSLNHDVSITDLDDAVESVFSDSDTEVEDAFNIEETLTVANDFNSNKIENTAAKIDMQVKSDNYESNNENKTFEVNIPPSLIVKIAKKLILKPVNIPPPPPLQLMVQRPNIPNIEMHANIQPSGMLKSKEKRDFSELSERIWVHICSYLKLEDLLVIRRTSKKIKLYANIALNQQRKQITIASNVVDEQMQFMLSMFLSIKELCILSSEIPFWHIIKCCKRNIPSLESLSVSMPTADIDVTIIGHLLPNLKALSINCANTNDSEMLFVLSKLTNLQKLEILNTKITGQCFTFISKRVTAMLWKIGENVEVDNNIQFHHLSLNRFTFISNFDIRNDRKMIGAISKQMPNLDFLSLSFFELSLKHLSEIKEKPINELCLQAKCIVEYQRHLRYSIQNEFTNVRKVLLDLTLITGENLRKLLNTFPAMEQLTLVVRSNKQIAIAVAYKLIIMKTLDKLILDLKNVKEVLQFENGVNILLNRIRCMSNIGHIQLNFHCESIHDFQNFDNLDYFLQILLKIVNQRQNQTFRLKLPLIYAEKISNPQIRKLLTTHS